MENLTTLVFNVSDLSIICTSLLAFTFVLSGIESAISIIKRS